MKRLLEWFIRRRNPQFRFDPSLGSRAIAGVALMQGRALLRGMRVLLRFRLPRGMALGRGVQFSHLFAIRWGRFFRAGDGVRLDGLGETGMRIGNNVSIGAFSRLIVGSSLNRAGSHIILGDNVGIGEFAYLGGGGGLEIGNDCIIGQYFSCHPEQHVFTAMDIPIRYQGVTRKGIVIGRDCWIGAKVTILDGVALGAGCVVAAGAVVTRSMPAGAVVAGVPARVIRFRSPVAQTSNSLI